MLGKSLENRLDENRKMEWRKPNITSVSGWEKANFTFMMGEMDNKQSLKNLWKLQEVRERGKKNHLEKHVLAGYWKRETYTNITSVFLQNLPTILACVTISKWNTIFEHQRKF